MLAIAVVGASHAAANRLPLELLDPEYAAFVEMGGSPDDICGHGRNGSGVARHCDACLLLLPALVQTASDASAALRWPPAVRVIGSRATQPTPSPAVRFNAPRAPPVRAA